MHFHPTGHGHLHRLYQEREQGTTGGSDLTSPRSGPGRPSHAEIAALAYSYWEARGRKDGSPSEDWFRAERELRRRA